MSDFINREEDYAIRIVVYLAGKEDMVKIDDIARDLFLSRPTVVKIVNKLKKCSLINTKTGKNGGIFSDSSVCDKSLLDILGCMGFDRKISMCADGSRLCGVGAFCNVNNYFSGIQDTVIKKLADAKVKDFLQQ